MRVFLIICVSSILAVSSCLAQTYYFRHYRVEDGLKNNTVFTVTQDDRGFMWFGSKEGLSSFDGISFKSYNDKTYPEDVRGFILSIEPAENGYLWIGTRKGVYKFNQRTESFVKLKLPFEGEITAINTDRIGKTWILSDQKLYLFSQQKESNLGQVTLRHKNVAAICHDKETLYACTTNGELLKYESLSDGFVPQNANHRIPEEYSDRITKISLGTNGKILICSTKGFLIFSTTSKTYTKVLHRDNQGNPIFARDAIQISPIELWIGTEAGIFTYNSSTGTVVSIKKEYNNPYSISDNAVYSLLKDREGGIWISTYFGGINYYHTQQSYFKKYFVNASINKISGDGVREICKDSLGNIWIGTEDAGLNKLEKKTGKTTVFKPSADKNAISSSNIHGLLVDGEELWVGTFQGGLDILNIKSGKVVRHYSAQDKRSGLHTNFIISLYKTRNNDIYVGTNRGLYKYARASRTFSLLKILPKDLYVFSLMEDNKGLLWISTIGNGVFFYDTKKNIWGNFKANASSNKTICSNMVCSVFQDSNNDYWFSTEGGGINYLSNNFLESKCLTTEDGLPSNLILNVLEDLKKNLWITTSKGLVRYNLISKNLKIFTKANGLLTDQFNYSSSLNDNGVFYFGTVAGLVSFVPANFQPDPPPSSILITSFQVDNEELKINGKPLKKSISFVDTVNLKYNQSSFSVTFAALSYVASQEIQYAFKMDGIDEKWTYLNENRRVYFTDLSPGNYTFIVKTAFNEKPTVERKLFIRISEPFWYTIYARLLYMLLFGICCYWAFSAYHKRLQTKNKRRLEYLEQAKQKEIYKAKIEFFTNVAHEIRTPLTLIRGPLENIMDEVGGMTTVQNNLKRIEKNTQRLLSLTTQLLDFRKTENNDFSLNFVETDIRATVRKIIHPYKITAEERGLDFNVIIGDKRLSAFIDIEGFKKIMDNLLTNAIKYAECSIILQIKPLEKGDKVFSIQIQNDGFVIPSFLKEKIFETFYRVKETKHLPGSGIGLSLARSLAELHKGTLVLSGLDMHTNVFVLTLPIRQQAEFKLMRNK